MNESETTERYLRQTFLLDMLSNHPARFLSAFATLLLLYTFSGCFTAKKTVERPPDTKGFSERQFRKEVVKYALQYEGSAYRYAGTNPRTGFDCSGFTSFVFKQFNVPVSTSSSAQSKEGKPVPLNAVQPGDLIIFGKNNRNIQHVAMVVERGRDGIVCVHSTTSRGVIRENVTTSVYWKPLILGARDVVSGR